MAGAFPRSRRGRRSIRMRASRLAVAAVLAALACSGRKDEAAKERVFSREEVAPAPEAAFDWSRPAAALEMGPEEAARRVGSLEWTAAVDWTVSRPGDPPASVHAVERHRVRQSATGEFEVEDEVDPGLGPGSDSGRRVVWVGGMTYARSRYAPFGQFRARPTDHGRDARRFRDESFGVVADVARLCGPALALEPAGETSVLGRSARRFRLVLATASPAGTPAADGRTFGSGGPDPDTKKRLAFLEGRVPLAIEGELLADAETGAPLRARIRGTFGLKEDPGARAQVEVVAQVRALGAAVGAVEVPKGALPDSRKPPGVSDALESAGLKQREGAAGAKEPGDDGD